jgi:predicted amino acid racemase
MDLGRIRANAARMMHDCHERGIEVMGVTKGVCGDVHVARALVESGVTTLGDARLDNLAALRKAGLGVGLWLLRAPSPNEAADCVALADGSLQSDLETLGLVAAEAQRQHKPHHVLVTVDLETGREGVHRDDVPAICARARALDGLELDGLAIYFDFKCTPEERRGALHTFAELARTVNLPLRVVSGGASNVLELALDNTLPRGINHLRLGTAPLLGLFTSHGPRPIEGWERDTFIAEAEVLEVKRDRAEALLALGHVDAPMDSLYPATPGVELLRQSSDQTVVRFTERLAVSDVVPFRLGYTALTRLTNSRYTRIVYI